MGILHRCQSLRIYIEYIHGSMHIGIPPSKCQRLGVYLYRLGWNYVETDWQIRFINMLSITYVDSALLWKYLQPAQRL